MFEGPQINDQNPEELNGPSNNRLSSSEAKQRFEAESNLYSQIIQNIKINFGRPEEDLSRKWKENKSYFGVSTLSTSVANQKRFLKRLKSLPPIDMDVTSFGEINNIPDGNTRLYAALQLGIDPAHIPVRFTFPGEVSILGTLSDALNKSQEIRSGRR